jgi:2-polyprenyl-3-methyl-5-hydroxy-6-metoxy-1,4-benzoquinol methylase
MQKKIINKLNKLNLDFYSKIGLEFDSTRNYFWQGWEKTLDFLNNSDKENTDKTLKVLDIGSGNGRFGEFLAKKANVDFEYLGIDSSDILLERAKDKLKSIKLESEHLKGFDLKKIDITEKILNDEGLIANSKKFDLIVLFGVMHHLPGENTRINLLKRVKELLSDNGILIFATWLFLDTDRLQKRIVWGKDGKSTNKLNLNSIGLKETDLEYGDYILDWQKGEEAFRYCHYYTGEEIRLLLKKSGLELKTSFLADGKENRINQYFVCSA